MGPESVSPEPRPALPRRVFLSLFAVAASGAIGMTGMQSVLPAIGREIGIPDVLMVSMFALSSFLWTVTSPVWARQADRRGHKPMILFGATGLPISMLICGVVVFLGTHHWIGVMTAFVSLLVARGLFGLIGAAQQPATQAFIAHNTTREQRTGALSRMAGAQGLGTIIGPAVAPLFVLPLVGLSGPLFAFALAGFAVIVVAARVLPKTPPLYPQGAPERGEDGVARGPLWFDRRLAPFLILLFLALSCQTILAQVLGFMIIDRLGLPPMKAQGFTATAMFAGAAGLLVAQWGLIQWLKLTPRRLIRWGPAVAAAGSLMIGFAPNFPFVVAGYALASVGFGLMRPGISAGISLSMQGHEQARAAGAMTSVIGSTNMLAPVGGILLYHWMGPAPYVFSAAVLLGLVAYISLDPTLRETT